MTESFIIRKQNLKLFILKSNFQTPKKLNDLTLLDRFLFAEAMDDPLINQLMLEIIFGQEIKIAAGTQTEKEFRKSPSVKSIRVDVFSMDEEGNVLS